jgi:hypothetical protein
LRRPFARSTTYPTLSLWSVFYIILHTDPADTVWLLRLPRERPRRRAAEQRHNLAPIHSIELHLLPLAREAA